MKKSLTLGGSSLLAVAIFVVVLSDVHLGSFDDSVSLGDALVAAGTLALAVVTFWLAWQTKREVGISTRSIDLAREGIEAQDMPFVIATANPEQSRELDTTVSMLRLWWGFDPDGGDYLLQIRLWNIGRGPAIARDVRLQIGTRDLLGPARPMRGRS